MGFSRPHASQRATVALSLEYIMDMCCCFFLSAGLLVGLYKLMAPKQPLSWAFWGAPLLALLLIIIARNFRRTLPVLVFFVVALLLFNIWRLADCWEATCAFFRWWSAGFSPVNVGFIKYYYLIFHLLPALPMTLCLWFLIRRRPPFLLLIVGSLAVITGLSVYGVRGHSSSIYLLAAGLIPLAASSSVTRESDARGQAALLALPLTAIILLTVFFVLPTNTASLRWQALGDKIDELQQSARDNFLSWQRRDMPLDSFDLVEEYHARLGGPISPNNTRMLMVQTNSPQLLKASVYDYYTGYSWEKGDIYLSSPGKQQARYNAVSEAAVPFVPEENEDALSKTWGFVPAPGSEHPLASFSTQVTATVTLQHPQEPRLFYYGQLTEFSSENGIEPAVEKNSELKSLLPLGNGYSYEFTSLALDRTKFGFTAAVASLPEQLSQEEIALNSLDVIDSRYGRQLPFDLLVNEAYEDTYEMALNIVNDGLLPGETRSAYEQAVLLERWLKENCEYTLTPDMPPENEDFVLHFLQTKEGYCAYYATTMVVMSRMIGIPARYVTGYALQPGGDKDQYEATYATAHAWAELFFDGVGWLPFDPTGRADYTEKRLVDSGELQDREFFDPERATTDAGKLSNAYRQLALAVLVLALLILLFFSVVFWRAQLVYNLPKLLSRFSPDTILELYYNKLLLQLNLLDWQRRPEETILGFMQRMGGYLPEQKEYLRQLGMAVSALRYGGIMPSPEELHDAALLHEHFDSMLHKQLKRGKYYHYRLRYSYGRG